MAESDTLLAYLVSSFPGNTENIATEALKHVFQNSSAAMEALNDVMQSGVQNLSPIGKVVSQSFGSDHTIPDLVGIDEYGQERMLVEVKFWADLTSNQPVGYINRLPNDSPGVVAFLVPDRRIRSLWPELRSRITNAGLETSHAESERKCVRIGDSQKHLLMVSWTGLLDSMAARSRDADEPSSVESDIRQLRTLAIYADKAAFMPIARDELLGREPDVRERQYERLVNAATDRGVEQGWVSRQGLRATPRPFGYGRYVRLLPCGATPWFGINRDLCEKHGNTPIWLWFGGPSERHGHLNQAQYDTLHERLEQPKDRGWIPLFLKTEVEFPSVLDDIVDQLRHITEILADPSIGVSYRI